MDASVVKLREDVEFVLQRIAPHLRDAWSRDIEARFTGWQKLPEFPLERGLRKLVSEFYVRALNPVSYRGDFYAGRNVVLDYLDAQFPALRDVHSVSDAQWRSLATILPALYESPTR